MKSLFLFFFLAFITVNSEASLFIFGLVQAQRSYTELGYSDIQEVKYEHDFESSPYGLGAEWRLKKHETHFFGTGLSYQQAIKVKQNTTFFNEDQNPSAFTSRNDLQHMSFAHAFLNLYLFSTQNLKLFFGAQYTLPEWRSHGRFDKYKIRPGFGYRSGIEINLLKGLRTQFFYRHVILDTKDQGGYEGELNISSLMWSLGWEFDC